MAVGATACLLGSRKLSRQGLRVDASRAAMYLTGTWSALMMAEPIEIHSLKVL